MGETIPAASWLGRISDTYNMLWKMVIRPPRDLYSPEELGPAKFRLGKRVYERRDLQLRSGRGVLECSHFVPAKSPEAKRPCVVYLHGNCSSRLEAFDALPVLLPRDLTVFCLDLSGSGRSDGEYISLGHHEEKDLRVVLQHLRSLDTVTAIGLWGRSMGATTSILRAEEDHDLAACVLDSAFRDLQTVAEELVSRGRFPVPQFLLSWALEMIRTEVSRRAGFDPLELMPINCAPNAKCPAFFGVASDDTFVLPHHTQDLHNAWAGERVLRVFDGGHNGVRPTWFLEEAADFLVDRMKSKSQLKAQDIVAPGRKFASDPSGKDDEEDSSGGVDGKPTPRLVSPLTECLQLDPRGANVPMSADLLSRRVPERKHHMARELAKMGFRTDAVLAAVHHSETVEEGLEWLLTQTGEAPCQVDNRPPSGARDHCCLGVMSPCSEREASPAQARGEREEHSLPSVPVPESPAPPAPPPPGRLLPGANLNDQLLFLGFDETHTDAASKRCLTMDAAMDYFSTNSVTVRL
uniref:Serine aminopeptidase S33 domain-containing protein n=1 Tax=Alexandrium catenella TaxID=2925 RepID=A0A7S1MDD3_ALECA|mmetsp:Transcript_24403/g.66613  ORF Transcript_24403/g.66613 Transcript_24403/m.66613 type:complete len:522 (+) Transcript_24403:45-1610(+)